MKKLLALLLALVMVLSMTACGDDDYRSSSRKDKDKDKNNGSSILGDPDKGSSFLDDLNKKPTQAPTQNDRVEEEVQTEKVFKVGAIYIGSKNDTAGYTYAHHNGIVTAMKSLGMDVSQQLLIVDEVPEDKTVVLAAIDNLVGQGVNIIFGISFGYIEAMNEAAYKYPDVIFSHATGYRSNSTNFNNYFGRIYQAQYLAGVAAGLKSLDIGNPNIGYVSPYTTEYAETASAINAFALGVQAANPHATVFVKRLGCWSDEYNERAFANELINVYSCGVIAQYCDSPQPQIVAQKSNVFGCGYNADMTPYAPQAHLTAPIWNWDVYYATAIQAAMECGEAKNFVTMMGGGAYYGGLKEGFVDISPLTANCAPNTQKAIDAVRAMMVYERWDVFCGRKLSITTSGNVSVYDAELMTNDGEVVVTAGEGSVFDSVITGTMNYLVAGVEEV